MKTICTLFLVTLVYFAKAQTEDYVITNIGDTVRCEVNISGWGTVKYKVAGGKFEKVKLEDIKEYYHQENDLRFRAVYRDSSNKPEYMRVLENGPISLYLHDGSQAGLGVLGMLTVSPTSVYVGKGGDRTITLKTSGLLNGGSKQGRKDALSEMLKDKPDIYNKYVADNKFNYSQILNLVHLYNTGKPYQAPKKKVDPNVKKDDMY